MKTKDCTTCGFWRLLPEGGAGECLRHAPSVFSVQRPGLLGKPPQPALMTIWPRTNPDHWCGDYLPGATP